MIVSNRMESGGEAATTATVILFDLLNTPADAQTYAIRQLLVRAGDRLRIVVQDEATGLAGSLWLPFS